MDYRLPSAGPNAELVNRFMPHTPTTDHQIAAHDELRRLGFEFAAAVQHLVPASIEQRYAIDLADAAVMWANAGLARHSHQPTEGHPMQAPDAVV